MATFDLMGRGCEGDTFMSILKPVLENTAERIAEANSGRVFPAQLLPCLPVSLEMVSEHLDEMVDDTVVFRREEEGLTFYEFAELVDHDPHPVSTTQCVHCSDSIKPADKHLLCFACNDELLRELLSLAETTAWPAQAVWQHEIFYLAAQRKNPVPVADIAGHSRLTLKKVKERLAELERGNYTRRDLDFAGKNSGYVFPLLDYPREVFRRNDKSIRLHPSSYKEELEMRLIKSLISLVVIMIVCLGLSIGVRIPFPLVLIIGAIAGAVAVWWNMTKSLKDSPDFNNNAK